MVVTAWTPERYRAEGYGTKYVWIDFVNSQHWDGFGGEVEYLKDPIWRMAFLRASQLSAPLDQPFPLRSFVALRNNLRTAATQISESGDMSSDLLRRLNKALAVAVRRSIEGTKRGYRMRVRPVDASWNSVESEIVASFAAFVESGQLHRLKACSNPDCRWVFFDATKNNMRRWCNDRVCGNRDRVGRYRAK